MSATDRAAKKAL